MSSGLRGAARRISQRAGVIAGLLLAQLMGRRPLPSALRIVLGLVLMIIIGTGLLALPISGTARPLELSDAFFTAVSALTVTGLSTITPATDLSLFGQVVLLLLVQVGGVGFMVVAVVTLRILGRRISMFDRLALSDSLGLTAPGSVLRLTRVTLISVVTIELIGALMLFIHWYSAPGLGPGKAAFYALFHAVSAFCSAGFDLFAGLPAYPGGFPRDTPTLAILGTLIFVGGLGIPVISDLITYPRYRRFSLHTRITLTISFSLLALGAVGIFLGESRPGIGALASEPLDRQIVLSIFQSISVRTAGFTATANFDALSPATQVVLIGLMFIGCPPASMGGGITTGTLAVLTLSVWSFARGLPTTQFAGRTLARDSTRKAAAILTIALLSCILATWIILITDPAATLDQAAFEVVSAFATCGLSLGFTTQLNPIGQIVICLMMFWGRVGALTIVVALALQAPARQPVAYPEEQIFVG